MNATPLTKELITDTSLWRLILRIDPGRLLAMLIGPESVERSVICHSEELADGSSKALENVVYDNPLLLNDFAAIDVIFSTPELCLQPAGLTDISEEMAEAMLPDSCEQRRWAFETFPGGEVVFGVGTDLFNFVTRTFAAARIHHSLAIDATYLTHRNRMETNSAKTYVLCEQPGEMAIVAFNPHGELHYLNRPQPQGASDCAYFTLMSSAADAPLMVGGKPELRNEVCDILRQMQPDARVLPLTLSEDLLSLLRLAPEASFDMLFLTQL